MEFIDFIEQLHQIEQNTQSKSDKQTEVEQTEVEENQVEENQVEENQVEENQVEENQVEQPKQTEVEENQVEENQADSIFIEINRMPNIKLLDNFEPVELKQLDTGFEALDRFVFEYDKSKPLEDRVKELLSIKTAIYDKLQECFNNTINFKYVNTPSHLKEQLSKLEKHPDKFINDIKLEIKDIIQLIYKAAEMQGGDLPELPKMPELPELPELPCIIGISGQIGSGKTTLANMIRKKYSCEQFAFADALKFVCMDLGFTEQEVFGTQDQKNAINEFWGISAREFMQEFGTKICRELLPRYLPKMQLNNKSIWTRIFDKFHQAAGNNIVISDVRFKDEASSILEKKGIICRIVRNKIVQPTHVSEDINNVIPNVVINNNGTLEDLENKLKTIMELIERKIITSDSYGINV